MSMKVHMLDVHLDEFKENFITLYLKNGAYSAEHGERFHQDINVIFMLDSTLMTFHGINFHQYY